MEVIEFRVQQAAENILENERLTAGLDDDSAQVLNDWGLAWAVSIAASSDGLDDAAAYETMAPRLKATRRLMRYVNKWLRKRAMMDPAEERAHLNKVFELAIAAHGAGPGPDASTLAQQPAFPLDEASGLIGDPPQLIAALHQLVEATLANGNHGPTNDIPL